MKHLKDFTLKEFEAYKEILNDEVLDIFSLLELFKYDVDKLSISEMTKAQCEIGEMKLVNKGIQRFYKVKDRRFKAQLDLTSIKAAQFIDLQAYLKNMKLESILSVFLLPQKKMWYGGWKTMTYNNGYDIFELQEFLYNNFKINDANELSAFFLSTSTKLLKTMRDYLVKKEMKMKLKLLTTQKVG